MTPLRRTVLTAFAAILIAGLAAGPASAQYYEREHTLRFRVGLFEPDGQSQYWDDTAGIFTGDASDFEDALVGFDYRMGLGGDHLALLISASDYSGEDDRHYLDFVDPVRGEIGHTASLDITSLTAGLVLRFAPHAAVSPYIGAGGGLYSWTLEERGRFIDFGTTNLDIFRSDFKDDGDTFGYYFQAGLDIPLGAGWALFAEGRWHEADDELSGDFEGLGTLDLSGREISAGASWTF